jgi:hypothetical protein
MMPAREHKSDGSDEAGRGLEVTVRIGPDGRLYLHDIPPDLLPVVLAMCPDDPVLKRRAESADRFRQESSR